MTLAPGMGEIVLRIPSDPPHLALRTVAGPEDYLLFQVADAQEVPVWARHVWGSWTLDIPLAKGSYTLRIFRDGRLLKTIPFTLEGPLALSAP